MLLSRFFFVKQKTAYEMRISDWSSDVCSSDLPSTPRLPPSAPFPRQPFAYQHRPQRSPVALDDPQLAPIAIDIAIRRHHRPGPGIDQRAKSPGRRFANPASLGPPYRVGPGAIESGHPHFPPAVPKGSPTTTAISRSEEHTLKP